MTGEEAQAMYETLLEEWLLYPDEEVNGMALPQRVIDAERALYIADDDLKAALAHGSEERKEQARKKYREVHRELRAAQEEARRELGLIDESS